MSKNKISSHIDSRIVKLYINEISALILNSQKINDYSRHIKKAGECNGWNVWLDWCIIIFTLVLLSFLKVKIKSKMDCRVNIDG